MARAKIQCMIFQYGLEPVLIQQKLIGFQAQEIKFWDVKYFVYVKVSLITTGELIFIASQKQLINFYQELKINLKINKLNGQ